MERAVQLQDLKNRHVEESLVHSNSEIATTKKLLLASYTVAWEVAKSMKPYTEGNFIKKCINGIAKVICPDLIDTFNKIKLSPQSIQRRVNDISGLIDSTIDSKINHFVAYSLALDESTDTTDTAQLAIFIRGVNEDLAAGEYLLDVIPLKGNTKGENLFQALLRVIQNRNLYLQKLVSVTTDGAPAMIGRNKGVVSRLKSYMKDLGIQNDLKSFHCIIHQESLWSKVINMKHVMDVVIKCVNGIRSKSLKHRQFRKLLKDLGEEYEDLPYYTEVRWLSRGKMLRRFFDARNTIADFLKTEVGLFYFVTI